MQTTKKPERVGFAGIRSSLGAILTDRNLAALGDAYVNFAYSLALSKMKGKPCATKVKGTILAQAFRKAGLRELMPSGMTTHALADAAEALLVYAWLNNYVTLDESVFILQKTDDAIGNFSRLLRTAKGRIKLS